MLADPEGNEACVNLAGRGAYVGEVRRRPDDRDRRVKTLLLTKAGTQTRTAFWTALTNDSGPLAHLTAAQAKALRDSLTEALAASPP